jgi:ketosteroid isomerase-like protein
LIEYIVNKVIDTREEAMEITRRHLAAAGALALGTASLLQSASSSAESADQAAIDKAVEALRKALLEKNKAGLEQLTADQLSYGHSSGKVQSKAEFVDGVMTSKAVTKSIAFPELTVAVVGDTAIARHLYESEMETDGKPNSVKIGALQVWQKQDGNWKLLARQGFKLA